MIIIKHITDRVMINNETMIVMMTKLKMRYKLMIMIYGDHHDHYQAFWNDEDDRGHDDVNNINDK